MKTVLCYGDSLTWGYNAVGPGRHPLEDRWPSVLQAELGAGVQVIAEGLNGRTTAFDDNLAGEDRNGARTLPTLLGTHSPIDVVVTMLGSNDMKPWIHGNPLAAKQGMSRLVKIVSACLVGAGAVTALVGVIYYLTKRPERPVAGPFAADPGAPAPGLPRLTVVPGPGGARAALGWRF